MMDGVLCLSFHPLVMQEAKNTMTNRSPFVTQNKGMQDPEIQNILTDPIMRQVTIDVCI